MKKIIALIAMAMLLVGCGGGGGSGATESYAYISDFSNLKVVDITDSNNPTIVGTVPINTSMRVALNGDYAYVAQFDALEPYLSIVDVSNPSNPTVVNTVAKNSSKYREVSDFYIDNNIAYISDAYKGLHRINIANGQFNYETTIRANTYTKSAIKIGSSIYSINEAVNGVERITQTNPNTYSSVASNVTDVDSSDIGFENHSIVRGSTNAVIVADFVSKKLLKLDSNNLSLINSVLLSGYPSDLVVKDGFAYVTLKPKSAPYNSSFDGVKVIDLSTMAIVDSKALNGASSVDVKNSKAYVVDSTGLHIYSISSGVLTLLSTLNISNANSIKVGE